MVRSLSFLLPFVLAAVGSSSPAPLPFTIESRHPLSASSAANIHLYRRSDSTYYPRDIEIKVTFGACDSSSPYDYSHQHIAYTSDSKACTGDNRLVWLVPRDAQSGGCLSAWEMSSGRLLARSAGLDVSNRLERRRLARRITMTPENGINGEGTWFDGVYRLGTGNLTEVQVSEAKAKRIGIVGAGISGLVTGLLLDSQGMTNWKILEASDRIGGRIRTHHFSDPNDYQYQEMGPMRFPEFITFDNGTTRLPINDHKLVFDLAAYLNNKNNNNTEYLVSWIPWYQQGINGNNLVYMGGIRKPDGSVPTENEVKADPSLKYVVDNGAAMNAEIAGVEAAEKAAFLNDDEMKRVAANLFKAHKAFIDDGWDDFSEFAFVRNELKASLNATDISGAAVRTYWEEIFDNVYFSAVTWRTIDKGLQRLADAFKPLLNGRIQFSSWVGKSSFDSATKKVTLSSRSDFSNETYTDETFDYAVVGVPFSVVRSWRFSPLLPSLITRAVKNTNYISACKVALKFKTRFWEHIPLPIYGGCSTTDLDIVGSFCYPSYALNNTGPGVLLASYTNRAACQAHLAYSDEEHADRVLDAIAEIHGENLVREQYTGEYARQCWPLDEYTHGGWADPVPGQHSLYIPEYLKVINGHIFVGEHTSYTHGWIAAAVESAVRGTVQLLLDLGLVDEAKEITNQWMGRWITI